MMLLLSVLVCLFLGANSQYTKCGDGRDIVIGESSTICFHIANKNNWADGINYVRLSFAPKADEYSRLHIPNCKLVELGSDLDSHSVSQPTRTSSTSTRRVFSTNATLVCRLQYKTSSPLCANTTTTTERESFHTTRPLLTSRTARYEASRGTMPASFVRKKSAKKTRSTTMVCHKIGKVQDNLRRDASKRKTSATMPSPATLPSVI